MHAIVYSVAWGLPVRRFFSNFAYGLPALGLLVLRIAAAISLVMDGAAGIHARPHILPSILNGLAIVDGVMLILGLWTPFAGLLAVAVSAGEMLVHHKGLWSCILLAAIGVGLTLIGPGAFSVDARLFGLKRIEIEKLNGSSRQ